MASLAKEQKVQDSDYYQEEITPTISENKKSLNCEIRSILYQISRGIFFTELTDHIKLENDISSCPLALGCHCHRVCC
ncbi:hypothetical protein TNCV_121631 [Trichonephila clavipes]|nr:hypothetical protein TNCV_121631 [Trichonephila clavipes]